MERPRITTIDGTDHEMRHLDGRAYRVASEFDNNLPNYLEPDFIEKHAALIAEFFDGVSVDDVLDMPLEDILPASTAVRSFVFNFTWEKTKAISKNAPEDKATEQ